MVPSRLLSRSARSAVLWFAEPALSGCVHLLAVIVPSDPGLPGTTVALGNAGGEVNIAPGARREGIKKGFTSIKGSCHNSYAAASKDVTYKELKNLLNSRNITLIDVRETWEILEYGKIPGSINIPLDEVGQALQMNPGDFKEKYSEVKPSKSDSLVFSCLAGVRSKKALDTAISLGFNSAQHYAGGWKEWATYEFSKKKQEN